MSTPAAIAEHAAEVIEIDGSATITHFGDTAAEYEAARHGVGLMHRARRALVRIGGSDRKTFLQGLLTNDVSGLTAGEGGVALFLDNKGHVRGVLDLWSDPEAIIAGCDAAFVDSALADLSKYILAADVSIEDLAGVETAIAVLGAGSEDTVARLGVDVPLESSRAHAAGEIAGVPVRLVRTPDLGTPGIELHVPSDSVDEVWSAIEDAAGDFGPRYIGWHAAEALRIEAGVVRCGSEITGEEFPQEARLDDAIDFDKGCYLGQETVARIHYRGQVNRLLSGVVADAPLAAGGELILSGKEVGRLTSAAVSPRLGPIGLAYVRREESEAGAAVEAGGAGARVVTLPMEG